MKQPETVFFDSTFAKVARQIELYYEYKLRKIKKSDEGQIIECANMNDFL